ncbi:class I SAM-dependent methyltransferase [Paenibacillus flagellatus]|uniref:SAM-dependent methyltransferase n=1 Tax=Paenibacillus flagellatus TaxID=2211139 RepID=A0A2V5KEI0_9BACL|nr:class I SAM-dependent methyltransferase [Paenibacillus flagellatus]PYI57522.1 SAM-dependent methyltransferase [Paenibacillus flagellatus]
MQKQVNETNEKAWNEKSYEAWVNRYGPPEAAAAKIVQDPAARIRSFSRYLDELAGAKIANLLGSHGHKAVAMALLGARVTVVDFSSENAAYALRLAEAAGTSIRYVVSDVLDLPPGELSGDYDAVLMEFGILHYFLELAPLAATVSRLLKPGGRLVLQDFHPVSTKLIRSRGTTANIRKHKVTGDYFDASLEETDVAYAKFVPESERAALPKVLLRKWTLGEIVTGFAGAGLIVRLLEEEPNASSDVFDKGIPKTFTLVAEKP